MKAEQDEYEWGSYDIPWDVYLCMMRLPFCIGAAFGAILVLVLQQVL